MAKVDGSQAQAHFAELIVRAGEGQERIVIEQSGKEVAAVISYADLQRLEALEDAKNEADLVRAIAESQGESYSVADVIDHDNAMHGTNFTIDTITND